MLKIGDLLLLCTAFWLYTLLCTMFDENIFYIIFIYNKTKINRTQELTATYPMLVYPTTTTKYIYQQHTDSVCLCITETLECVHKKAYLITHSGLVHLKIYTHKEMSKNN